MFCRLRTSPAPTTALSQLTGLSCGMQLATQQPQFALLPCAETAHTDAAVTHAHSACLQPGTSRSARLKHVQGKNNSKLAATSPAHASQEGPEHHKSRASQPYWLAPKHVLPSGMLPDAPHYLTTTPSLMTETLKIARAARPKNTFGAPRASENKEHIKRSPANLKRTGGVSGNAKAGSGLRSKLSHSCMVAEAASPESTDQHEELDNQQVVLMRMINAMAQVKHASAISKTELYIC
jgi:hypothetical protein